MAKRKVGLYIGVSSLSGVVWENRKIVAFARHDLASLEEEARVENLNDEVKWEALINKTLRELKVEGKDVSVSIADRDFIFRSLEMPMMSRKEIESALSYEIEKYVPFKVEELMSDFNYVAFHREKKVTISFIGMRESNFQRTYEILTRLGLNPVVVEPSAVSLARVLKSIKGFTQLKNFALLDFTDTEAYLTFFYYDLPVFNRYFAISRTEEGIEWDKFVEPVHLSFQYFQREFKSYELDKFIIVSNNYEDKLVAALKEEIPQDIISLTARDFIGKDGASVENIKALGVAGRDSYSYKFKPVFLKRTKEHLDKQVVVRDVSIETNQIAMILVVCAAVCATMYFYFQNQLTVLRKQIAQDEAAIVMPDFLSGVSINEQQDLIDKRFSRTRVLKDSVKYLAPIYPVIKELPNRNIMLPDGLWFDKFQIETSKNQRAASIHGYVFLGDPGRERNAVNAFVENLKANQDIARIFRSIRIESTEAQRLQEFDVTSFTVALGQ